ncbi:MAG TPA: MarR family transcriptional regulator [Glaciihabitans sp.]|nr:MarR family transcriptional regulator [Glaciihabitans sp.]
MSTSHADDASADTGDSPMPRQTPEQMRAWLALLETANRVQHATDREIRATVGLTFAQLEILGRIAEAGSEGMRMTDIADTLVVSRSGLTYQVGQLEQRGLVTRAPSSNDERSVIARVTASGLECVRRAAPHYVDIVATMFLDHLSPENLTTLADILDDVRAHLRTMPNRSTLGR